jgi:hypothetical protein
LTQGKWRSHGSRGRGMAFPNIVIRPTDRQLIDFGWRDTRLSDETRQNPARGKSNVRNAMQG